MLHKHVTKIAVVMTALAVCFCLFAMLNAKQLTETAGGTGVTMEYETALFDTDEIMTVDILVDEAEWEDMLQNASSETYIQCDVEVNGSTFYSVGIRPKGNTSLTTIAADPTTDRYSFKIEFDQFVDGQTCFGLDKLILNNNYADATNMKEALIYDMFQYLGADASLYNYAKVSVNGEYWGLYLALEAVEDSFLLRNYGVNSGELYKPDSMNLGSFDVDIDADFDADNFDAAQTPQVPGGDFNPSQFTGGTTDMPEGDFDPSQFTGGATDMPEGEFDPSQFAGGTTDTTAMPEGDFDPSQFTGGATETTAMPEGDFDPSQFTGGTTDMPAMPEGDVDPSQFTGDTSDMPDIDVSDMGGVFSSMTANGGADLNYIDDDLDSYSTIWDGEVTSSGKTDHQRVVEALKNISEGNSLEQYMDVDNLLKYMAVHVFSVNSDSLTGMMAHNYYLYEEDGSLNLIPWDYNLALGGMDGSSDASGVVNDPIDNAFTGTNFFDTLMEVEAYHTQYYAYLAQLAEEYLLGDGFETFYQRTRSLIDEFVETDPTAFYTYDEYLAAVETLYQVVKLRGESIQGQVSGAIPSTKAGQTGSEALIDTTGIDLSSMGSMETGGGNDFGPDLQQGVSEDTPANAPVDLPEDLDISQWDGQFSGSADDGDMMQFGSPWSGTGSGQKNTTMMSNMIMYGACLAVMLLALLAAKVYHRRSRK